jgi:energy-coupling factor transporter ATP-binding protein EcfA2
MQVNRTTLAQAATVIRTVGQFNTIILRGQPGVGKSSILKELSLALPNHLPCYVDVANLDLGDLGMPVIDRERMVTNYAPSARFGLAAGNKQPVILMLDELGKASRLVLNMLLPVIFERRLGDVTLPAGSIVFATTNLDTDGVGDNIPAHAYNRMTELVISNPTVEGWIEWAMNNDVAPEVMAFVKQNPEVMTCYTDIAPGEKNPYIFNPLTGNTWRFVSPRSLEKASNIVKARHTLGEAFLPSLAGTLGDSAAQLMVALVNLSDTLPTWEQIVTAPTKTKVPKDDAVGAQFLLALMLAARVDAETMDAMMAYQARLPSFEARALCITTLAGSKTKVVMACRNREFTKAAASLGKLIG